MRPERWLLRELPELEARGLISAQTAEALRSHYQMRLGARPAWGRIAVAILGAVLTGLGVILLVAHNWSELSRPARTVIAFLPLLIAQSLAAFALLRRATSTAWREASGVGLSLAIGASIALIEQTYHLGSADYARFLLTWTLLALPVVYLLRSSGALLLVWTGLVLWMWQASAFDRIWYWPLLSLSLPYLWWNWRHDPVGLGMPWLARGGVAAVVLGVLYLSGPSRSALNPALFAALFCLLGLIAASAGNARWAPRRTGLWGAALIMLVFSYRDSWSWFRLAPLHDALLRPPWQGAHDLSLLILLLGAGLILLWRERARLDLGARWAAALPWLLLILGLALPDRARPELAASLVGLYTLGYALLLIRAGARRADAGSFNGGLLILSVLILMRFVDWQIPYLWRALAFIALGLAFLLSNLRLRAAGGTE